jgi:hypothetical protein
MHAQVHSQRPRGTKEDPPRSDTSHVLIGQERKPRERPGSDRSAWPPITSYNNNNRPHEGFLTVRSPDRGPRTPRERERKRERRRGARRHTLLMWHETWRQNHQIRRPHALFHVSLSLTTCAVTWLFGLVPFGVLGPHPPPNRLVWGSVIGSRRRFITYRVS